MAKRLSGYGSRLVRWRRVRNESGAFGWRFWDGSLLAGRLICQLGWDSNTWQYRAWLYRGGSRELTSFMRGRCDQELLREVRKLIGSRAVLRLSRELGLDK